MHDNSHEMFSSCSSLYFGGTFLGHVVCIYCMCVGCWPCKKTFCSSISYITHVDFSNSFVAWKLGFHSIVHSVM